MLDKDVKRECKGIDLYPELLTTQRLLRQGDISLRFPQLTFSCSAVAHCRVSQIPFEQEMNAIPMADAWHIKTGLSNR